MTPAPLQPRVPLLIAGGGERGTLRLVAEHADASNFGQHPWLGGAVTVADVRHKWEVLRGHCETLQRPYASVLRSHFSVALLAETPTALEAKLATFPAATIRFLGAGLLAGTPDEVAAGYRELVAAGVQYFVVGILGGDTGTLRLLGERVMPTVTAGSQTASPAADPDQPAAANASSPSATD